MATFHLYKKYIIRSDIIKYRQEESFVKELVFATADNCLASEEVQEKVSLFIDQNPDVVVTRLKAENDLDLFASLSDGWKFNATPAFTARIDGKVVDRHQGRLCEVRLGKMFTGGDSSN
jgi:hypothetical protein